jgi:glycosyltransferase involved in cell wall biosynthesis
MGAFPGGRLVVPSGPVSEILTVIPVYNGARYLRATLESLAAQTVPPGRVVVIDDVSTDGTPELVEDFFARHPGLHGELRRNERNQGLFGNLNRCLDLAAETDLLHILLADDLVLPRFLERLAPTLTDAAAPAMAWSLTEKIDGEGRRLPHQPPGPTPEARSIPLLEFVRQQGQLQTIFCGSVLLKTSRQAAPCRFPLDYPQVGDCVFYADWARHSSLRVELREILCQIRHHGGSATTANSRRLENWVSDELRAMRQIAQWAPVSAPGRWLWSHRIQCLFAARSVVKQQLARPTDAGYAEAIGTLARSLIGPWHWWLGRLAVFVRDRLFGPHPLARGGSAKP